MLWGSDRISFQIQSYYVVFRDDLENTFKEFITSEHPELTKISPRWQAQIAALFYGVPVDKALQTLLDRPLREAIRLGSASPIKDFNEVPGLDDALEALSNDLASLESKDGGEFGVVLSLINLLSELKLSAGEAINQVWSNMCSYYCSLEKIDVSVETAGNAVLALSNRMPSALAERFVELTGQSVTDALQSNQEGAQSDVKQSALAIIDFCANIGRELPWFGIFGLCLLISWLPLVAL